MKKLILTLLSCMLMFCVQGQSFLTIGNDPVTTAKGGVGVASEASGFSIYNNTAATALTKSKWEVAYSYSPYMWDFDKGNNLHTIAGYYKLSRRHALATGIRYYNKANVMLTDNDGVDLAFAKPRDMSIEAGYAFKINKLMGIAANLRFIHSDTDVPNMKGTAVGMDIGYYLHKEGLGLGIMVSNIGSKIDFGAEKYSIPGWIRVGATYEWPISIKHILIGSAQFDYNFQPEDQNGFSSGMGIEYMYDKMIFLRGGYRFANDFIGYSYATMGIGANIGFASLNFTYIVAGGDDPLNKTMMMSIGIKF